MKYNGSRIILECLKEQGVDTIFGYPGGAVLNIFDALYSFSEIRCVLTSHEQGASHAADGYARATGKVGVCLATSGPGATNLVTGIATAYMDSVPMVAITGQVATSLIGKDSFQEVDITDITMPITKHNFIVRKVEDLADTIRKAFYIAQSGRPGPVLIDIPKDVTGNECEYEPRKPEKIEKSSVRDAEVEGAIELLLESKRPVIIVGGGCNISEASKELKILQEKLKCPVCSTMMGLGAFSGKDDMFTGMVGMHGTKASNKSICESDLVIAIGCRFSDRVTSNADTFAKNAKILHIDIDEAEVSKNIKADSFIIGDVEEVLKKVNEKLTAREGNEWTEYALGLLKKDKSKVLRINKCDSVNPVYVIKKLYELTDGEAIITTEVGQNQIWATQGYIYTKPRSFITSGGLGTMGYGFGAAIGASVGKDKMTFDIAGDGSFRMNINELATVVRYKLPVKIIVLNNNVLGMVRQWQNLFYKKRYSSTTLERDTDFVKIAEGYGALGLRVDTNAGVESALKKAIDYDGPVVIDFTVGEDEMATPIVPPGADIENMVVLD
ncbi:acetolactate synthase-1/2/3 large subunit [Clostridium acetobutylicum]|uniref:Acetolactate synthase n=1 Tax=Clostridium acetobutylicum (strain ATCC 824 / DSM 792 / JCM 1419 / IAM 19013 / LMG 5710 / NBRC 13948 / NRRL B-527 / VKM B-1787 / 2291 / W) TaxID=272562 RepID=Q97EE4_CLOAB|nr:MULTISPECIES: biosynthetic-type acetolactate synthase large subunit [Clostridium]AAK81106.1 Acetolactate synthase large subunit [Clostridium acetobutylicum ATCC 824]ADZ22210.1 Acetolactate synthase large subunit [Clostridium acetobutylicum EA 2018]AEI34054.1 acetolactate synthase large subunit [Clostridium acetobutylicum DSM 1731]AWV82082.1 biosynthetic-type acetolactate synthase large subunit [Clostridium acetobutylicum]MBC2393341.1 biosynthetic-type acetolactate synthase large subunit [Cl